MVRLASVPLLMVKRAAHRGVAAVLERIHVHII
jgi:hypothetical protein